MAQTGSPVPADQMRRSGSRALSALGLALGLVGAAWWAFDADPLRGQVLLVVSAATAIAGRAVADRLSPRGQRLLLLVVSVLALGLVLEVVHLVQVVMDQRASHPA